MEEGVDDYNNIDRYGRKKEKEKMRETVHGQGLTIDIIYRNE